MKDLQNQRFGRLVVESFAGKKKYRPCWQCKCDCGKTIVTQARFLISGEAKSCGCYRSEFIKRVAAERNAGNKHGLTHGKTKTPTYRSWLCMKTRCCNEAHSTYPEYGGRGIAVCERWRNSFEAFYEDMGERPKGKTLDRIDVNGMYEPGNCRWASAREQYKNKRALNRNCEGQFSKEQLG